VVLEDREARRAELPRDAVGFGQLLGGEVRASDRARLSRSHELVERAERLRDRCRRIGLVEVVEVDVIGPEPLERAVDRATDVRSRPIARPVAPAELRRENDLVATALEDLAKEALAPASVAVDLRGVEERDTDVDGRVDDRPRGRDVEAPAEVVAAQTDT